MHPAEDCMKHALVVPTLCDNIQRNIESIISFIDSAANKEAKFIIFPEACLTGFITDDVPEHDYKYAVPIDSPYITYIKAYACKKSVYISLGFLESVDKCIYDSVVCINPLGSIIGHYRRISAGWHGRKADSNVYKEGEGISTFTIGKCSYCYLLCGDLFEDNLIALVKKRNPEVVIVPIARSSENRVFTQELWNLEERPYYLEQVKKLKTRVFMTNYIDVRDNFYGGAFVINSDGIIEKQKSIYEEGILYWENGSI